MEQQDRQTYKLSAKVGIGYFIQLCQGNREAVNHSINVSATHTWRVNWTLFLGNPCNLVTMASWRLILRLETSFISSRTPAAAAPAAAKSLQSCPTLCDPTDGSPPGSPIPGILQARTLEWVAISFSSAWKWKVKVKSLSHVWLFMTPWTAAHQAPPSMGFSRQGYWSGVPLPSPSRTPRFY